MRYQRLIQLEALPARPQPALDSEPFNQYIFDDGSVWTEFHRDGDNYLLRFPGLADFHVSADGRRVGVHPVDTTDESTIEHLYINQLVPLALSRQGIPTFHASVVTVPGGAVAFLGKTGAGKSTLAASFALQGSAFLTDDGLIVEETDEGLFAQPSHASLRLWDDSAQALISGGVPETSKVSYSDKSRLVAGEALAYSQEPAQLLAAFQLAVEEPNDVSITELDGSDQYRAWLENSFLLDIEDREQLAKHFDWTHRISDAVPTYRLDYVRDFCMLPDVRRAILAQVVGA